MADIELLNKMASNLHIADSATIEKASEYLRSLQHKPKLSINEQLKVVMCLDLAATKLGTFFDKSVAQKTTSTKKVTYEGVYITMEKLLELNTCKTVQEICVLLSCLQARKLAEQILDKYKLADNIGRDFSHPQYSGAAVSTACKIQNVSVNRRLFLSIVKIKAQLWIKLEAQFMTFAKENGFVQEAKVKNTKRKNNELMDRIQQRTEELEKEKETKPQVEEVQVEKYLTWKKRILAEAYHQLGKKAK